jgi:hypothetical protein
MAWGAGGADTPHAIGGGASRVGAGATCADTSSVRLMLVRSLAKSLCHRPARERRLGVGRWPRCGCGYFVSCGKKDGVEV